MISFSRIAAAFTVIALFVLIIVLTILATQIISMQLTHGNVVGHKHGIVLSKSKSDNSLMFKTDSGQVIHFACSARCLAQLGHMQRHIYEHAPTDVYYTQENQTLVAVDVD
jgi:hypothetical protein